MYFQSLQTCVKDRGPAPLVTWLSDVGRIELSATTFNNAVSKASNFLIDGLEIEEDSSLSVDLGNHWQAPVAWYSHTCPRLKHPTMPIIQTQLSHTATTKAISTTAALWATLVSPAHSPHKTHVKPTISWQ
jgi:hypothetical protein